MCFTIFSPYTLFPVQPMTCRRKLFTPQIETKILIFKSSCSPAFKSYWEPLSFICNIMHAGGHDSAEMRGSPWEEAAVFPRLTPEFREIKLPFSSDSNMILDLIQECSFHYLCLMPVRGSTGLGAFRRSYNIWRIKWPTDWHHTLPESLFLKSPYLSLTLISKPQPNSFNFGVSTPNVFIYHHASTWGSSSTSSQGTSTWKSFFFVKNLIRAADV